MKKEKFIEAINQKGLGNNLITIYYNIGRALPFIAQRFPDGRVSNWYKSQYVEVHDVKPSGKYGMYGKAYGFYYRNGERADAYEDDTDNSWCKKDDTIPQEIPCGACGSWILLDIKGEPTSAPTTIYGLSDVLKSGKYKGKTLEEVIETDWGWVKWAIKSKRFYFDLDAVWEKRTLHPHDILPFGKYKGKTILDVAIIDKDYLLWVDENSDNYIIDFEELFFLYFAKQITHMCQREMQREIVVEKLILLLALIEAIETGVFTENQFVINDWLEGRYNFLMSNYTKGLQPDRAIGIEELLYSLETDGFWHLNHQGNRHHNGNTLPKMLTNKEETNISFDDPLWILLQNEKWRKKLRIVTISQQISETDSKIDTRVFDLYGLAEEERKEVMGRF